MNSFIHYHLFFLYFLSVFLYFYYPSFFRIFFIEILLFIKFYKKNPEKIKLRYIYRKFNIGLPKLTNDYREFIQSPIDLSHAYSSQYIIGLCLTYHVNYGLSYRQTSSILKDIHEVNISYKTVENYCKAASSIVNPVLEFYPYELSDTIAADETYIKIHCYII